MLKNPLTRKILYVVVVCAGVAAVAFGLLDQGQADQWVAIILGAVGILGGGTAIGNISPKPATVRADDVVAMIGDALAAATVAAAPVVSQVQAGIASRVDLVDQARRELEAHLGGGR